MLENYRDQPDQRVNFPGDPHIHPTNPHPHEHHFNQDNHHHGNYSHHHENGFANHDQHFNQYHHMNGEPNNSFGNGGAPHFVNGNCGFGSNHSMPRPARKRGWHHSNLGTSPDQVDGACHVKVYVAPVPRTTTEADIRLVFEGHGTIVEVILLKDKRTGIRQGSCLVKYATLDEADRAIKALSNQYTFPGESSPIVVRFADRELERLGVRGLSRHSEKIDPLEEVVDKVFVGYLNKEASKKEIEEIFSPYGHVEDIFIAHSRGYGFVKFSNREMALAAIKGLNRTFTMRGCDHPLIVRFADPKKPKTAESRGNYLSGNAYFGPCSHTPAIRPLPNVGDSNIGGSILPMAPHHSTIPHPQVASHMQNWEPGATVVQQPFPPHQAHSQLASMPLQPIQAPNLSSQPFVTEVQRQFRPADSSTPNVEQQLSSQMPTQIGSNPHIVAGSTSPDTPTSPQEEAFPECDWSEHTCPDGYKYYYNCVTCESRLVQWVKPEEYALYDKESPKQQQEQEDHSCLHSQLSSSSPQQVAQRQQETNHVQGRSETSPVV